MLLLGFQASPMNNSKMRGSEMWVNCWSSKIYLTIDLRDRIKTLCAFVIEDKMILPRWNKYRKF